MHRPLPMNNNHHQQNNHLQLSRIPQGHVHHNHQQNIQFQQSMITQEQRYNHSQPRIHLQQSVMHQSPTYLIQHITPRNYNPTIGSTTYSHYALPQTNGQCIKKQEKYIIVLPKHKIPVNSPILWELSQEIMEWKFLGRYLNLEEDIIDEIDYNTRPNKTRDKALKVLTEWVNISTPTWETLGKALMDAEYVLLYEKLLELIKKYAVG